MKSKFAGLNFDSVEVLTQEEKKKVKGGYDMYNTSGSSGNWTYLGSQPSPHHGWHSGPGGGFQNGCGSGQFVSNSGGTYGSLIDCLNAVGVSGGCNCKSTSK